MKLFKITCNISNSNALHKMKLYDIYNLCPLSQKVLRLGLGKYWVIPGKGAKRVFLFLQTQSRNFMDKGYTYEDWS
jgi:hypothetical protein